MKSWAILIFYSLPPELSISIVAKSWLHGDLFLPQRLHAVKRSYCVRIISSGFCWLHLLNISWACFLYVFSTALVLPLTHCLHARSCLQSALSPLSMVPRVGLWAGCPSCLAFMQILGIWTPALMFSIQAISTALDLIVFFCLITNVHSYSLVMYLYIC